MYFGGKNEIILSGKKDRYKREIIFGMRVMVKGEKVRI